MDPNQCFYNLFSCGLFAVEMCSSPYPSKMLTLEHFAAVEPREKSWKTGYWQQG